jgi:hypothetical protein
MYHAMAMPVKNPMKPPMKVNTGTLERFRPMAPSIPCTGNGVSTSHFLNPASRTLIAA